jgi:hypothetical protein
MGLLRKAARRATPRSVRKAAHPIRTARRAATPRVIKRARRAAFVVANPFEAIEGALEDALLDALQPRRRRRRPDSTRASVSHAGVDDLFLVAAQESQVLQAALSLHKTEPEPAAPLEGPPPLPLDAKQVRERVVRNSIAHLPWYRRTERRRLREAATRLANNELAAEKARRERLKTQHTADLLAAHQSLLANDRVAVQWFAGMALARLPVDAAVYAVSGQYVECGLVFPGLELVHERSIGETPTGRPTTRNRTKTRRNELYLEALASAALLVLRTAAAAAPKVSEFRLLAARQAGDEPEVIFAAVAHREALEDGLGSDNAWEMLNHAVDCVVCLKGRTRELKPLPRVGLVAELVASAEAAGSRTLPPNPFDMSAMQDEQARFAADFDRRIGALSAADADEGLGLSGGIDLPEVTRSAASEALAPRSESSTKMARLALWLGIASIPLAVLVIGVVPAVLAIGMGASELRNADPAARRRAAVGLCAGLGGLALFVALVVAITT